MAAEEIDRYLEALEEPKRGTLEEMRRRILEVIPGAEQCLSYAVPAFKVQRRTVAGLAAVKNHLSHLPHSGSVLSALAEHTRGYSQTGGALHFAVDKPLPRRLVRQLVRTKMREVGVH
jgi:uncharacterized protein YdhG (YjbR/CyaY superfamily)